MKKRKNSAAVALGKLGGAKTSSRKKLSSKRNGALGGRPSKNDSLFEAATRCKIGEDWRTAVFDFVDAFRHIPSVAMLKRDPLPLNLDMKLYSMLQAIALSLVNEQKWKDSGWYTSPIFLNEPWFVAGIDNLKASALQESPYEFRRNNIFVLGNFLRRV